MKHEKNELTKHAVLRMKQRRIPESLIYETINNGRKIVLPDRDAIEHRMKNILGIRGTTLVVVTSREGAILTSYVEKYVRRHRE